MNGKPELRILVVEDDKDIQFAVGMILELNGDKVYSAANGQEALDWLARNDLPDLILLDMSMPVMDGWHFAAEFRTLFDHQVPIVVMTAASNAARRAQDIGADGFLSKPFSVDQVIETVTQYGQSRRKKAA